MLHYSLAPTRRTRRVPDPLSSTSESELRQHIERALSSQYDLDREVGRGGMGIVYRARDRRLKRTVAIKLLPPELAFRSEIRSRFMREAEMSAQLNHPNIVPIYSVDERENLVYFVMAFVDGDNLAKRLHDLRRLPVDEVRRILCEVASALDYAHARNVIHRDIKPDNILLDAEHGRAVVTDFGIARAVSEGDSRLTATGMAIGTPAYMSPEQCAGERDIDGRSDLYSLGVVGYQMVSGELPFTASNTPAMLVKHISERPIPLEEKRPDVPPDLARAIMLLLEKDPADRFPDAGALVVALENGNVPALPRHGRTGGVATGAGRVTYQRAPARGSPAEYEEQYAPTPEEMQRWTAEPVERFRRKVAPYIAVNIVIVLAAIFGAADLLFVTTIWTIFMAYKYAKLWTEGYDWRDVFRQPRDRQLLDVTTETIDDLHSLFNAEKRRALRERSRQRRLRGGAPSLPPGGDGSTEAELADRAGGHAAELRQAAADRDAIVQVIQAMPRHEREQVHDVVKSANVLYERIRALGLSLAELERAFAPESLEAIEEEISRLEAQANPLERAASEERVRRLAFLKRQRRAVVDGTRRREAAASRLEQCTLTLKNMRFDVLRLRAGAQSHEHVTSLALQAMELARSVDYALVAAEQVGRLTARAGESDGGRASERA